MFVCSRNRWRSPTAEAIFASHDGVETMSAGLAKDAEEVLGPDHLEWADIVFVMEATHHKRLFRDFSSHLAEKPVVVLGIRDEYRFMNADLVALLETKMRRYLTRTQ